MEPPHDSPTQTIERSADAPSPGRSASGVGGTGPPSAAGEDATRDLGSYAALLGDSARGHSATGLREELPSTEEPIDEAEQLAQGDFVGRYSVLSRLGQGGMGVVYKAYDPQLDRNVAIKLLRRGRSSVEADLRLLREAQTLAKLKHPNVVAVYDAGLTNHGVFIAMELLEGCTLRAWLEQSPRRVSEVLAVFRAAGRGLIAAHEVGFVHRDFKPSNVNVEDDGSVKVLDFGLAHFVEEAETAVEAPGGAVGADESTARTEALGRPSGAYERFSTREGVVIGTPAFMAPEQLLGERSDHRSEQFSFAMSLYVALYDRSPLGGTTYEERRRSIEGGLDPLAVDLQRSASGERVPARVRAVIVRGLANEPLERFESMAQLLAQLEEPRRRWREAVALLTLVIGFGVGAAVFDGGEPPCSDPGAGLDGIWSDPARAALGRVFEAHAPDDAATRDRVLAQLDDYAEGWVEMYGESCRATFVDQQQSEQLFDQRMRCLQRRRNRLHSAMDSLVSASSRPLLVQRTIAPFKLPALAPCADLDFVMAEQPPPEGEAEREQVAQLRRRLDEIVTFHDVGDYLRGVKEAEAVVQEAEALGYAPLLAEALEKQGLLQLSVDRLLDAQRSLERAIHVGAVAHEERAVAAAWVHLLFVKAQQNHVDEGLVLELPARAAVERLGDTIIHAWLLNSLGYLYARSGEYEASIEHLRRAQDLKIEALGEGHVDVGLSWLNLGNALLGAGSYPEAEAASYRARVIFDATVGRAHPMSHSVLRLLGLSLLAQGQAAAAIEAFEAARTDYPDASPDWLARVSLMLARAHWRAGSTIEARQHAHEARAQAIDAELREEIEAWLLDPDAYERGLKPGR